MKKIFLLSFILINASFSFVHAQAFSIEGTLIGLANQPVYLMDFKGERRSIIDTAKTDLTGSFRFELKDDLDRGIYLINTREGQMIELILNGENVQFVSTGKAQDQQVQIISSIENMIYYDYLYAKGAFLYKTELLLPLIQYYPQDQAFYQSALDTYFENQNELNERITTLTNNNPNTLSVRYIAADKPLFIDPTLSEDLRNSYQKIHHFDEVDFNDSILIRGSVLSSKIVEYLAYYQYNSNSQEQLENNLLMAVDSIMDKALVNQTVYEFVVDFIINGFNSIGFDKGLDHIAQHSKLDQFCVNTERKLELENRLDILRKLAVGKQAPNIETTDIKGNTIKLSAIEAKKTLVVFWASWCPHCDQILPKLQALYASLPRNELEVIAVSVDEDKEALMDALEAYNFNWINIGELKGWDGPVILEYGIAATPTVFVLDAQKTIIGKPDRMDKIEELILR